MAGRDRSRSETMRSELTIVMRVYARSAPDGAKLAKTRGGPFPVIRGGRETTRCPSSNRWADDRQCGRGAAIMASPECGTSLDPPLKKLTPSSASSSVAPTLKKVTRNPDPTVERLFAPSSTSADSGAAGTDAPAPKPEPALRLVASFSTRTKWASGSRWSSTVNLRASCACMSALHQIRPAGTWMRFQ